MIWLSALHTAKPDGRSTEYEWIQMLLLPNVHVLLLLLLLLLLLSSSSSSSSSSPSLSSSLSLLLSSLSSSPSLWSLEEHSLNKNKLTFYKGATFLEWQATGRSRNASCSRYAWANRDVSTRSVQIWISVNGRNALITRVGQKIILHVTEFRN